MMLSYYSSLSIAALALALDVAAAAPGYINSTVEDGIETACKVCPWDKCINTKVYPYFDENMLVTYSNVTLVCWTRGDNVGGTDGNKYASTSSMLRTCVLTCLA